MAFRGTTLEAIIQDINERRQRQKISFAKVTFGDDEYHVLRQRAREIFSAGGSPNKSEQIGFLAFACAYMQRNVYLKDYSFWEDFHVELDAPLDTYSDFIADKLLWPVYEYKEVAIQRLGKQQRRLIVDSLVGAVCAKSLLKCAQFVDFFCWFYQYTSDREVSGETLQKYQKYTGQQLPIAITAQNRLSHDCTLFATILDYIYEQNWSLTQDTFEIQQDAIIPAITQKSHKGDLYHKNRVELVLRNKDLWQSLLQRLDNHTTPELFFAALKDVPTAQVQRSLSIGGPQRAHTLLKLWQADALPYDYYWVNKIKYSVGPFPWLWLETIEQWPYEEVVKLRRKGYIAYKKQKLFTVHVGDRSFSGRLSADGEGKSCHVWIGKIIPGELVRIDGELWEEVIGLTWSYTVALGFSQEHEPVINVFPTGLSALLPARGDSRLVFRTSQGDEERYLLPAKWLEKKGQWLYYRGSRFTSWVLKDLQRTMQVSVSHNGKLLDEKTLVPEQAYLFSEYTHERIPPNTKREWGVRSFYLFVAPHLHPQASSSVSLEPLPMALCGYTVYRVEWDVKERSFELQVGELSWSITQQRYCFLQVQQTPSDGPVHLTRQQIQHFDEQQLLLWTNLQLSSAMITCLVLIMSEQVEIQGELLPRREQCYAFSTRTIQQLNERITGQHLYGECDLILMQDEQILARTTVVIIPEIEVKIPCFDQPLLERAIAYVEVKSPHLELWSTMLECNDHQVRLDFRPTVMSEPWSEERTVSADVRCLVPATVHLLLTFPPIGQSIEIRVRPLVFGFRLYQRQGDQRYQCVDEVDYYHLDTTLLHLFTKPGAQVSFYLNEQLIHSVYVDATGNLLLNEITRFRSYCTCEWTTIRIVCAGLTSSFAIRWTPRVYEWHTESSRVRILLDGPLNTAVLVRLVTADNEELARQDIACCGRRLSVRIDTREAAFTEKLCYLVPSYCLSDGSVLPSAQQWRLGGPKRCAVPQEWFSMGIGCSDEVLLKRLCDNH
jgi:hypothetical protein